MGFGFQVLGIGCGLVPVVAFILSVGGQVQFRMDLPAQLLDFPFQLFVFLHLAAEKTGRDLCLLLDAVRRQQVHVGGLVAGGGEALDFDDAFFDQFPEAVIELAEAEAHGFGHLALGEVGVCLQELEEAVTDFGGAFTVHDMNSKSYRRIKSKNYFVTKKTAADTLWGFILVPD